MISKLHFFRSRRAILLAIAPVAAMWVASIATAQQVPVSGGPVDPQLIEDLVAANRILADQGVLDGWGHVSVRHPRDPNRYLLSRSRAPELVSIDDILEFDLGSNPVDAEGRSLYTERFIHGEIYKARPDVMAIVHTHAPALIPFSITKVQLKPVYHRSAFVSAGIPVFEIRERAGMTDMLIRDKALGRALADALGNHPAALMRGHGAVIVGASALMNADFAPIASNANCKMFARIAVAVLCRARSARQPNGDLACRSPTVRHQQNAVIYPTASTTSLNTRHESGAFRPRNGEKRASRRATFAEERDHDG
jgi:ribulose-5-phosphate 4-epimerase/fuculose-1-phosphate aldolase